jgi:MYXO-CTERM domain-containing protein
MGTTCTGDAGVDGGTPDAGDGAVDPDAGDLDAGPVDADPDATVDTGAPDTGAPDTGAPDTGAPDAGPADTGIRTDAGPIGRGPPNSKTDMFDEGCGCAATRKEGHAAVALFVIALLWLRQRW